MVMRNALPQGVGDEAHHGTIIHGIVSDVKGETGHLLVHQDAKVVS